MAKYPHGKRVEREPVWDYGLELPVGSRDQSPWWGSGAKPHEANCIYVNNGDIWPQNETIRYHQDGIFSRLQRLL
jgi:hypothetical protein